MILTILTYRKLKFKVYFSKSKHLPKAGWRLAAYLGLDHYR